MTINPYIEKKLEFVMDCADELTQEQTKYIYHMRNNARQEQQKQQFLAKRVCGRWWWWWESVFSIEEGLE